MMRLVTSRSHRYHFRVYGVNHKPGLQTAITCSPRATSSTLPRINWSFSWSLDKQRRLRDNNEHNLASCTTPFSSRCTSPTERWRKTRISSFSHYQPHNSSFSCSPLHILPSGRVTTSTTPLLGTLIPTRSPLSVHQQQHCYHYNSFNLAQRDRFHKKMNILYKSLDSSSSRNSNRPLFFPFQKQTSHQWSASLSMSSGPSARRFISSCSYPPPPPNSKFFFISPTVREALGANRPVVALESAIITHGMPFPDNIQTALGLEEVIRNHV